MKTNRLHYSTKQKIQQFIISAVIFFAVTMPFRKFFALSTMTEIRPAAALPPFFGMIFGVFGALGCAVGNLVADLVSGYGISMSMASFPVQFLMGILPYILWYRIPVKGETGIDFPRMDKVSHVLKYMLIILGDAVVITFLLGCILHAFGAGNIISETTVTMFWNNLDFAYILGLPLFSLAGWRQKRRFSLNEQLITAFLVFSILAAFLVGIITWQAADGDRQKRILIWNQIYTNVAVTLNVFIVAEIIFLTKMEKQVTIPIQKLSLAAEEYVQKDSTAIDTEKFASRCEPYVSSENEIGHLAGSYVHMAQNLQVYMEHLTAVTAEKERISAELDVAARIQKDMLPSVFPPFPDRKEFDIFASMTPAREVGGDFYDFFLIDENHIALVMADVSGKGIPAALFMVNARTLIRNYAMEGQSPSEILSSVNEQLCENNREELFVTVWLAVIDLRNGEGIAANAGHEHPALCHSGGEYEYIKYRHSPAVAAMEGMHFREHPFHLYPGDSLFVYTDGVTEAVNKDNVLFGEKRLLEALNASIKHCNSTDISQKCIVNNVKKSIASFAGNTPQFDDITMMGFRYSGSDPEVHDELELTADLNNLEQAVSFVEEHLAEHHCPQKVMTQIGIAVEEIFVNIAHYAYVSDTGPVVIRVSKGKYSEKEQGVFSISITFIDHGIPYNPLLKKDPDITLNAEERPVGGLGIYLVRKKMDDVSYEYKDGKNILVIRKTWSADK